MVKKQFNKKILALLVAALMLVFGAFFVSSANTVTSTTSIADTTNPAIVSVSPTNNREDLSRSEQITVVFNEDMDPSTINANTFVVVQRTTPALGVYRSLVVDGTVTYAGRTATFTQNERFSPSQQYGNVFTVTISGAKDVAGNSLLQNYVWSFTTGGDRFNTGTTTQS